MLAPVRDYDVSVEDERSNALAAKAVAEQEIAAIREKVVDLELEEKQVSVNLKSGAGTAEQKVRLVSILEEIASCSARLKIAEAAQTDAEAALRRIQRATDDQDFEQAAVLLKRCGATILKTARELSLAFGSFCACVDTLQKVGQKMARYDDWGTGLTPDRRQIINEASRPLDPTTQLLDEGLEVTKSFGWDRSIRILPLREKTFGGQQ